MNGLALNRKKQICPRGKDCNEEASTSCPDSSAVTFVQPSAEAERVLEELCGTALDSGDCDNDCDAR